MSAENVEIVKEVFAAWDARDPEAALKHIDPDIEVDFTQVSEVPAATSRGTEGLQGVITDWLDVWESLDWFTQNFIEAGDHVIVWLMCKGRGRGSGVPLEWTVAGVNTVRHERVVGFRGYDTLEAAAGAVEA